MYKIFRTKSFKKDYKNLSKDDKQELKNIIIELQQGKSLLEKYKDHKLIGNYLNCRECHIEPNLLLIYRIDNQILELALSRVGSHSKLL